MPYASVPGRRPLTGNAGGGLVDDKPGGQDRTGRGSVGAISVLGLAGHPSFSEGPSSVGSLSAGRVAVALASGAKMSLSVEHTGTLLSGSSPWSMTLVEDKPRIIPRARVMWVVDGETGQRHHRTSVGVG